MSRSSSRNNRSKRMKPDEEDSLLGNRKRNSSATPSYRSFPDHESWSATSSTITPSHIRNHPEVNDQLPEGPSFTDDPDGSQTDNDEFPQSSTHGITRLRATLMIPALGILLFLQASNISLLTTTQGVIAGDLDAFEYATWFTSAYLVALSSTGPVYGKLSYIFQARYLLFATSLILILGALVTAFTPSVALFLVGRALSGVGAAGVLCIVQVLIQYAPTHRKGLAQGLLNLGYTTGVAAGAILAGAIQPALGWRAMFWLQIPAIIVAGTTLVFATPASIIGLQPNLSEAKETPVSTKLARIDYLGAVLLVATLVSLLYGLASPTFDLPSVILIIVSLVILLPLFIYQESFRHSDPIIPVKVLKSRPVLFGCLSTLGFMMSRWAILFYTPVYAIAVRGLPPASAGTLLVPTNVGFALGSVLTGQFHIRRDGSFYLACMVTFTIYPVSILSLALASTATISLILYWLLLLINGFCAGAGMNYTLAHIQHLVQADVRLIAISIFFTFRGFAGTFGSTVGGGIFNRALAGTLRHQFEKAHLHPSAALLRQLIGSPRAVQDLSGTWRQAAIQGYVGAIKALFLAAVGMALVTLVLQTCTGWKAPEDDGSEDEDARES